MSVLFLFLVCRNSTSLIRSVNAISENEIINSLPTDQLERGGRLFDFAMDSLINFIVSHSLEIKFPETFVQVIEEGRGLKKKWMSLLTLAIALKALILAKIALFSHFHKGHHKSGGYALANMMADAGF